MKIHDLDCRIATLSPLDIACVVGMLSELERVKAQSKTCQLDFHEMSTLFERIITWLVQQVLGGAIVVVVCPSVAKIHPDSCARCIIQPSDAEIHPETLMNDLYPCVAR